MASIVFLIYLLSFLLFLKFARDNGKLELFAKSAVIITVTMVIGAGSYLVWSGGKPYNLLFAFSLLLMVIYPLFSIFQKVKGDLENATSPSSQRP